MTQTIEIFIQLGCLDQHLGSFLGIFEILNAARVQNLVPVDTFIETSNKLCV